jgi:hypothetical protein
LIDKKKVLSSAFRGLGFRVQKFRGSKVKKISDSELLVEELKYGSHFGTFTTTLNDEP